MKKLWVLMGVLLLGGCATTCKPNESSSGEKTERPERPHHLGIRDRF
ncbi:MAG: hypothetical protein JST16_05210 [Bdellovibrionales bacterium]|nr:hypothetical protein [Bdellovibrionales bacterium]